MKNKSIWTDGIKDAPLPKLDKDITCDILVLGGGIAGLTTAYFLKDSNLNTILIEKDKCALGATSKNTGKLTFMQDLIYNKIESNYDRNTALLYLESQREAIETVVKIVKQKNINCHLSKTKSYVFTDNENNKKNFQKEINFYKENSIKYNISKNLPINYPCKYVLETDDSYVFNPYEYLLGLKKVVKEKVKIYENTRGISVDKIDNYFITETLDNHTIKSKYVIVCTHYPLFVVPYFTPFKTIINKFFLVAGLTNNSKPVQIISNNKPSISMRYYQNKDNYLIYGRRNHSASNNLDTRRDYKEIIEEYKKYFNNDIKYYFQNHDLMSYDSLPFIGKVNDSNLYIATGFNKWGNTNGTIAGKVISDIILNKDNKYKEIFNPKRGLSKDKIKNLTLYNIEVMSRYIVNKISSNMSYYNDNVEIKTIDGKKCGIYIDENKNKHIVSNICPHMKCNLVFNYVDKTWDCPCHASRFDIDGNVIYGPSVYDIKIKNE